MSNYIKRWKFYNLALKKEVLFHSVIDVNMFTIVKIAQPLTGFEMDKLFNTFEFILNNNIIYVNLCRNFQLES